MNTIDKAEQLGHSYNLCKCCTLLRRPISQHLMIKKFPVFHLQRLVIKFTL